MVSFAKGFSKHPHISRIFKMVSEYSKPPFRLKVDYFILYWILVSTTVSFLPFFAMNKRRCNDEAEISSFIRIECVCSSVNRNERQTINLLSLLRNRLDISYQCLWYLSSFFLEWSLFSYFSCYVSLGFTIRTVRAQNNHWGFEFSSFFHTCFPLWLILSSAQKSYYKFLYMTTGKLMLKRVNG